MAHIEREPGRWRAELPIDPQRSELMMRELSPLATLVPVFGAGSSRSTC